MSLDRAQKSYEKRSISPRNVVATTSCVSRGEYSNPGRPDPGPLPDPADLGLYHGIGSAVVGEGEPRHTLVSHTDLSVKTGGIRTP
mgnify:FL=1